MFDVCEILYLHTHNKGRQFRTKQLEGAIRMLNRFFFNKLYLTRPIQTEKDVSKSTNTAGCNITK